MFRRVAAASCLVCVTFASSAYAQGAIYPQDDPAAMSAPSNDIPTTLNKPTASQNEILPPVKGGTTTTAAPTPDMTPLVQPPVAGATVQPPSATSTVGTSTQPPVTSNIITAPPAVAASNSEEPAVMNSKPLLVIRFNQNHVYFAHSMEQAIKSAESAKSGVSYNIVNYVPAGGNREQSGRNTELATTNLQSVLTEMQSLGVDASRITQSTQPATAGMTNQEIQIFVK